jgi:Tol biopolymer transport system component
LLEGELPPASPAPTSSVTPQPTPAIPAELIGKIAFKSNRTGQEEIYVINPDGTGLALLTNRWPYNVARLADSFSIDGRFRVFTKDAIRYAGDVRPVRFDAPALYWYDSLYKQEQQLTDFGVGLAYDGAWSPTSELITFVSNDSGDDEIWLVSRDRSELKRLTETNEVFNAQHIGKDDFVAEVNKHPSWSPDGKQIVFWSTRSGHPQIWVMNQDGTNPYSLSRTGFNDWDPVWIKYPGIPANAQQIHIPYIGPFDPYGPDRNCGDFTNPGAAQAFYLAAGGPARDPHELDNDQDGIACSGS